MWATCDSLGSEKDMVMVMIDGEQFTDLTCF
jgi:hypothetical protein